MPSISEAGYFCTNGMSRSRHDSPFANSGFVVTIPTEAFGGSDVLAGVRLQQVYERRAFEVGLGDYLCPIQRAADFMADRETKGIPDNSYPRGAITASIAELVPPLVLEALKDGLPILDRRWHGRFLREATLVGPESRGSAPVRICATTPRAERRAWKGCIPSARRRLRRRHRPRSRGRIAFRQGCSGEVRPVRSKQGNFGVGRCLR